MGKCAAARRSQLKRSTVAKRHAWYQQGFGAGLQHARMEAKEKEEKGKGGQGQGEAAAQPEPLAPLAVQALRERREKRKQAAQAAEVAEVILIDSVKGAPLSSPWTLRCTRNERSA
eukprot:5013820-Amphidinium_carterae.1